LSGGIAGAFRSHNQVDVAIKHLKKRKKSINGLATVLLVKEPIELCRGSPEAPDDLSPRQGACGNALLRLDRKLLCGGGAECIGSYK
jgi:hypothetical protein